MLIIIFTNWNKKSLAVLHVKGAHARAPAFVISAAVEPCQHLPGEAAHL